MDLLPTMQNYFRGEKAEAAVILGVLVLLLVAALLCFVALKHPFARGLAAMLVATAVVGASVGGTVFFRTDKQLADLTALYQSDRAAFRQQESTRMDTVMRSFGYYRIGYALACLIALLLVFNATRAHWHGVAVGLLMLAAIGFTIDYFAEERGQWYRLGIHKAV